MNNGYFPENCVRFTAAKKNTWCCITCSQSLGLKVDAFHKLPEMSSPTAATDWQPVVQLTHLHTHSRTKSFCFSFHCRDLKQLTLKEKQWHTLLGLITVYF